MQKIFYTNKENSRLFTLLELKQTSTTWQWHISTAKVSIAYSKVTIIGIWLKPFKSELSPANRQQHQFTEDYKISTWKTNRDHTGYD